MRVIGVDDRAWRKRQRYGTILMDLEQNAVVDLLQDRSTESFTGWLERHPGVEIITRDRFGLYAAAGSRAAPDAVQIADRFHLLQNLSTPWSMTSSVCRSRPAAPALYQLLHKARDQSGLR